MTMRVAHICNGCGHITYRQGRCDICAPKEQQHRNQQPARKAHHTTLHRTITRIVKQRDPNRCAECGTIEDLTIDYIVALANGGRQHSDNARILCRPCNSRKGAR